MYKRQIPGNGGGTYTPQPWQQVHQCAGAYMTGNVVINPIPSNFIDFTSGQTVFNNGAFGPLVNHGWFTGATGPNHVSPPTIITTGAITMENGKLRVFTASNQPYKVFIPSGTINLTSFRYLKTSYTGVVLSNTNMYANMLVLDSNTRKPIASLKSNNETVVTKTTREYVLDISGIVGHHFIAVGLYSPSLANPTAYINYITLTP